MKHYVGVLAYRAGLALGMLALLASFILHFTAASAEGMAFVRVVHASPGAGNVDVFADDAKLLSDFTFSSVTDYVSVTPGAHTFKVAPAGKGVGSAVITQALTVEAGMYYTAAALGTDASSGFSLKAFVDDNMMAAGKARVRVYHLSPNAGPVDVAAAPGGAKVITGLTYQNASDYLAVDPGAYNFQVTATQANATVPVPATLNAGTVDSIFAVGLFQGNPALKFVTAAVNGTPGMPGTGSDPNAASTVTSNSPVAPFVPWALGGIAVALLVASFVGRRFVVTRHK